MQKMYETQDIRINQYFDFLKLILLHTHIYIYIYIYACSQFAKKACQSKAAAPSKRLLRSNRPFLSGLWGRSCRIVTLMEPFVEIQPLPALWKERWKSAPRRIPSLELLCVSHFIYRDFQHLSVNPWFISGPSRNMVVNVDEPRRSPN